MKIRLKHPPNSLPVSKEYFWMNHGIMESKEFRCLPTSAKLLYVRVCDLSGARTNFKDNWWFRVSNKDFMVFAGLSRSTIFLARKALVKAGLIEER